MSLAPANPGDGLLFSTILRWLEFWLLDSVRRNWQPQLTTLLRPIYLLRRVQILLYFIPHKFPGSRAAMVSAPVRDRESDDVRLRRE